MLSRIYIDNYKCLVNFTLELGGLTILHGDNGSGKSTVFDAFRAIRKLLIDECNVKEAFPVSSKTRFEKRTEQHFELDFKVGDNHYSYILDIHQSQGDDPYNPFCQLESEKLMLNGNKLFSSDDHPPQEEKFNLASNKPIVGLHKSMLAFFLRSIRGRDEYDEFRNQISQLHVLRLEPGRMDANFDPDAMVLADDGSNFPSWWSNKISGENSHLLPVLYAQLGEVIEGFRGISLQDYKAGKRFTALIERKENGSGSQKYAINELSDGERVLLVLYSLLYGTEPGSYILCLDEPDNFVSLPELHPWLMSLYEQCEDHGQQALVISHHPEFYDFMGGRRSVWFKREANSPTRVIDRPQYPTEEDKQGLKLSELVARGWLK